MLLALLIYVFAVTLTTGATEFRVASQLQSSKREISGPELLARQRADLWWGSMGSSFYTLFACISGGISWDEPAYPLFEMGSAYAGIFFVYMTFAYFAVLNVITAVFCEAALEGAREEQEHQASSIAKNRVEFVRKLNAFFEVCDLDANGTLSREEFEAKLGDEATRVYFETLDISVDNARDFFSLLDQEGDGC